MKSRPIHPQSGHPRSEHLDLQPPKSGHVRAGARSPLKAGAGPKPEPSRTRGELLEALGARIRYWRGHRELTRQALAQRAGLSLRFIAQLEGGQGNISVAKLAELARALAVPLRVLLEGDASWHAHTGDPIPAGTGPAGSGSAARQVERAALEHSIAGLLPLSNVQQLREALDALQAAGALREPIKPVIALVGLRGAGKSSVGALLARRQGRPFVELDALIQEATSLELAELFELHGEDYYRREEREALRRLVSAARPVVVAVSGGIVTNAESLRLLREGTTLVWLKARPEEHMHRVVAQGDRRPMANRPDAMAELQALLRARTPYYQQAALVLDSSGLTPAQCAARLGEMLGRA